MKCSEFAEKVLRLRIYDFQKKFLDDELSKKEVISLARRRNIPAYMVMTKILYEKYLRENGNSKNC